MDVVQRGSEQIDLVGTDIGAMVAYALAVAHPEDVGHLVLSESHLPGFRLQELMNPATGGYWHFGFHMQVDLAEMLTAGKEAAYLEPGWAMSSPGGGLTEADRAEFLSRYSAPSGMRGGFQHYATPPHCPLTYSDAAGGRAHGHRETYRVDQDYAASPLLKTTTATVLEAALEEMTEHRCGFLG